MVQSIGPTLRPVKVSHGRPHVGHVPCTGLARLRAQHEALTRSLAFATRFMRQIPITLS
jgi:hypothetical protein